MYTTFQQSTEYFHDAIPFIMEGQVVATDDPDQMGRIKVWVPSLDGENFDVDKLPWVEYASPFFGFTVDYPAGGRPVKNESHAAYGFWAIPKIGATVLIFCLNANPALRFYFASTLRLHRNRSFPAGRNTDFNGKPGPWGDAGDGQGSLKPIQPAYDNLREQFQDKIESPQAKSRGFYERQVAQAKNEKDGKEGYQKNAKDPSYLDPQTYAFVTPGRHALIFQDHPESSRIRLKTAEGHQIIFDDSNERIYISTSKGKTWVELDQDGHMHVFGSESISIRSGKDINFLADRDFNIEAKRDINIKSVEGNLKLKVQKSIHMHANESLILNACESVSFESEKKLYISTKEDFDIHTESAVNITGEKSIDIRSSGTLKKTAKKITLNDPDQQAKTAQKRPKCPEPPIDPPIVPGHEPWTRPKSKTKRGENWKE